VYEGGSFVPSAKIIGNEKFSIVNDYIGRPVQSHDNKGDLVWETEYDIYGGLRNLKGDKSFIPFRQLGQYEDVETGLYYNRFRYYSPETGLYLSQDPIGLAGNNPNFYAYVSDTNTQVDPFGLDIIRLRHYTSNKGLSGIKESMTINAGDQNAVFAVKAKGKPLSMADAAEKFKVKENHTRNYIDFDIDDSRVEFRKNNLGVEEYKIKGNVELDSKTTKFVSRCK
jgi:type VI secretion system protein VasG